MRSILILGVLAATVSLRAAPEPVPTPAPTLTPAPAHGPAQVSRVYYTLDPSVLGQGRRPDPARVRRMVDNLVMAVAGENSVGSSWLKLIGGSGTVGIKVSAGAGLMGGTRVAVAEAVAGGLRDAGFPRERILVWDRDLAPLLAAGYRRDHPDYTLRWIDGPQGYDPKAQVSAPVLGRLIWGDSRFGQRAPTRLVDRLSSGDQLSTQSFYSQILANEVDRIVNIPAATDSFLTGVHGAIAGITLANLDNWRRFVKEPYHGDPYLAEIYADETIQGKVALTLLDALMVQYAGGPHPNPSCSVDNGAIFASTDPVAIDATLLEMVDELRKASRLPPAREKAGYLDSAEQLGLGHARPAGIQTLRAGVMAAGGL